VSANNRIVSVVDDYLATTKLFHEALSENIDSVSVFSFNDPIMAFQHFTENNENYVLVISDLRMPGLNGLELLKKVKTLNPNVRTILMSAYNFEEEELYQEYPQLVFLHLSTQLDILAGKLIEKNYHHH
jgi:DNA-binding NtrC family response regulator